MIEIERLGKRFGDLVAVDDVSLTMRRGTITALVGASGSGKSTLLRMINRLIAPSAGAVRIDGVDTASVPPEQLRRGIGYVIQGHGLFPHWNVARNIATVPRLLGWPAARIDARVRELLALFNLAPDEFAGKLPHELSGGQQQRVGVARALAAEPAMLLMDEPFGALDEFTRNKLDADLVDLWWRRSLTVLFVTHSIYEAVFLSTRIVVMAARPGRIFAELTIDEPHPRGDAFRRSPCFAEYCQRLSALLTEASLASDPATTEAGA